MEIKNIVFDIGNVLIRWGRPSMMTSNVKSSDGVEDKLHTDLANKILNSDVWQQLHCGAINEQQAIKLYVQQFGVEASKLEKLVANFKQSLVPIKDSIALLEDLSQLEYKLYCITDNTRETVDFLATKYRFFDKFAGVVVSSEVGATKPDPMMYQTLTAKYNLLPQETVFIDDLSVNVQGAIDVGWHGIVFTTADACKSSLEELGIDFKFK